VKKLKSCPDYSEQLFLCNGVIHKGMAMYGTSFNMHRPRRHYALFASIALLLSACSNTAEQTAPGGVNAADAKALDDAAAKLDAANQLPPPQPASK
jgi:hypothetical protein